VSTLAEEAPDYAEKVTAYLKRMKWRRLPWGSYRAGEYLTVSKTHEERHRRAELGEVALQLLDAMGVPVAVVDEITTALPWNASAADLIAKLQEIRGR
jgi:hypothetical protein